MYLLFFLAFIQSQDWFQWGGAGRGFQTEVALASIDLERPLIPVWQQPIEPGNSGLVVADEAVITQVRIASGVEAVVAMSIEDGQTLWRTEYRTQFESELDKEFGFGPHSTPCRYQGLIFAIGTTGELLALDGVTGQLKWKRELWREFPASRLERGFAASPLCWKNSVIVSLGGAGCSFVAFDVESGQTLWSAGDAEGSYTSPAIHVLGGRPQLIGLFDRTLLGVDPDSGAELWSFDCPPANTVHVCSPFSPGNDQLLICSSNQSRAVQIEERQSQWIARELWNSRAMTPQVGNVIVVDGLLVGPSSGSSIALTSTADPATGKLVEKVRLGGPGYLLECADGLISINERGVLTLCLMENRNLKIAYQDDAFLEGRPWSAPALVGKSLYVRDRTGVKKLDFRPR